MKRVMKRMALMITALVMLLAQAVFAEDADLVKDIFETLTAEGSDYSENKAIYQEYYPNIRYEETLEGDRFTIAVSGSGEMDGSWTFVREGDDLTVTSKEEDYSAGSMAVSVLRAVGDYYGMNTSLLNAYIAGLGALGLENPYFRNEMDEKAGTVKFSICIAGPYDMKELDRMVLTGDVLDLYGYEPLTEDYTSRTAALGKVYLLINGSKEGITMLAAEYGELDDLVFQDLINVVKALQPDGWETFTAEYTALRDAETATYSVTLNVDEEAVRAIIDDSLEGYSYAIVRIGKAVSTEEETVESMIDETYNGTVWESGSLKLESVWQDGFYKIAITDGETERSYLCDRGMATGRLFSIGTGIAEEDSLQPDYGRGTFFCEDGNTLVWQKPDGEETVFTRVAEP